MVGSKAALVFVMSFWSSSRVNPTASFAAIFAIGYPVAFDARALERETRGFISMTSTRPSFGFTANWTFEPPVSTPISCMTARAASRSRWYSRSVSVRAGATVIESPVWTPIGSMFSMEQMTMKLSAWSRMTSSSNSFQPMTLSSTSTSRVGELKSAHSTFASRSSGCSTMAPPAPPMVKLGLRMTGYPVDSTICRASSTDFA